MTGIETVALIGIAGSIAGSVVSAGGMIMQGMQQSAEAQAQSKYARGMYVYNKSVQEYNARMQEYNAQLVEHATADKVNQQRRKGLALLSSQRAGYGASGVTLEGTPLAVMDATAQEIEKDVEAIKWSGETEAWKLRSGLQNPVVDTSDAYGYNMTGSIVGAGTTLLTGVGNTLLTMGKFPSLKGGKG